MLREFHHRCGLEPGEWVFTIINDDSVYCLVGFDRFGGVLSIR